jgi:hypothetical protein
MVGRDPDFLLRSELMSARLKNWLFILSLVMIVGITNHFIPGFKTVVTWICYAVIVSFTVIAIRFDHSRKNVLFYLVFLIVVTGIYFI